MGRRVGQDDARQAHDDHPAAATFEEALETTKIHSVAGVLNASSGLVGTRPFRSVITRFSDAGLIGGGMIPRPGEVSLVHNRVLFFDELPEFLRSVLEVMRQPREDGNVTIARAATSSSFPARFMLVGCRGARLTFDRGFFGPARSNSTASPGERSAPGKRPNGSP